MCLAATQWKKKKLQQQGDPQRVNKSQPVGNNSQERDGDVPNRCEHLPARWETSVCQELLNVEICEARRGGSGRWCLP